MTSTVATITLKTTRPQEVARFWRDLLGYTVGPNHSDSILLVGEGPSLLVQPATETPTTESPAQGAVHLDLRPDDHEAEVARALALGAVRADIGQAGDEGWAVLADPGGTLFCILDDRMPAGGTPTPLAD